MAKCVFFRGYKENVSNSAKQSKTLAKQWILKAEKAVFFDGCHDGESVDYWI